jgi:ATP-dependent DNA helicase RecG
MTATPIPRTIAMTVFGDVDVSTLSELPAGRAPITTHVVSLREHPAYLARAWARVREEVAQGHRVFVVCPRIGLDDERWEFEAEFEEADGDRAPETSSVLLLARSLAEGDLAGLRIGVLHGRMSGEDKDDAMRRFGDVEAPDGIDVLVSTTVIEVGVDVPAATMMVIMDAERFGMSQLHQLRGRVGRGGLPGLCLLVTGSDVGTPGRERLAAVSETTDGFVLSDKDLDMRREGDVLGRTQSGRRSSLRLLEVSRHEELILDARAAAGHLVEGDPLLEVHPALADAVEYLVREDQSDFLDKA